MINIAFVNVSQNCILSILFIDTGVQFEAHTGDQKKNVDPEIFFSCLNISTTSNGKRMKWKKISIIHMYSYKKIDI